MKLYLVSLSIFLLWSLATAQLGDNASFILNHHKSLQKSHPITQKTAEVHNEVTFFASMLLRGYQRFISSQDKSVCIFSTSCSNFSQLAIENRGFIEGTLLTADRLTRCNSHALHYYSVDARTQRRIDTVILYYLYNQKSKQGLLDCSQKK